jgi:hypothetical protein
MHMEQRSNGTVATIGRKLVVWVVLVGAALLALKLMVGILVGFVQAVFTVALVIVAVVAVFWAWRRV